MSGVVFVDTNILIYAHDADAGSKRARAENIFGCRLRFLARRYHHAARHGDAILLQNFFSLILMNFHNDSEFVVVVGRQSLALVVGDGCSR